MLRVLRVWNWLMAVIGLMVIAAWQAVVVVAAAVTAIKFFCLLFNLFLLLSI
jgi:hypothetical protein